MKERTKGKKDVTFCIETFNDMDDTKVHIEGTILDIMTIVGMAVLKDDDLMNMLDSIVNAAKKYKLYEQTMNNQN